MTIIELPLLRNSERLSFKTCQKQWDWAWNHGLIPNFEKQNARWFGTGIHLALAEWYTPPKGTEKSKNRGFIRGRNPLETWDEFSRESYVKISSSPYFDQDKEKEFHDSIDLGKLMLAGYMAHYKQDEAWEILVPEQRFNAKIPYNARQRANNIPSDYLLRQHDLYFPVGDFITRIVGTFDMPIRDHGSGNGIVKIIDHKTAQKKESGAHLVKEDQGGTYISVATHALRAMGLIKPNEIVQGMIFNYLRKAGPPTDKILDSLGRVRNKPVKNDYYEAFTKHPKFSEIAALDYEKMKVDELQALSDKFDVTVFGAVSKLQPAPLFWREHVMRSRAAQAKQLERIADDAEQMALIRGGLMAPTKFPDKHCAWCDFNDLCDIDEDNGDTEAFIEDMFKKRDPYADHRDGAKNSKESVQADKIEKKKAEL